MKLPSQVYDFLGKGKHKKMVKNVQGALKHWAVLLWLDQALFAVFPFAN